MISKEEYRKKVNEFVRLQDKSISKFKELRKGMSVSNFEKFILRFIEINNNKEYYDNFYKYIRRSTVGERKNIYRSIGLTLISNGCSACAGNVRLDG